MILLTRLSLFETTLGGGSLKDNLGSSLRDRPSPCLTMRDPPKRRALNSFGVHWRGREGDSDDWAVQHLHIFCPGLRPGEVTPASLYSVGLTQKAAVTGYKSMLDWRKEPDEPRIHGVGFAVKNSLLTSVEPPTGGTECILSLCLATAAGTVNIFSIYAPTLSSSEDVKDHFYDELETHIGRIPPAEPLLLLGDFNASVGSDHQSWPSCIGHDGVGKRNDNGQRLLELCSSHSLCVTNTYFQSKLQHRVLWKHPRRSALSTVLETRSYHSADCDTDHTLVCSKEFVASIEQTLLDLTEQDAVARWNTIREANYASILAFGKRERKNHDWFDANLSATEPVIEAKRKALLAYKNSPSEKTLAALRTACNNAQSVARRCANNYWLKLCEDIQRLADSGNVRGIFDRIKKAVGPEVKKTAPLKPTTGETITDREQQMKRWVEHYSELYTWETEVTEAALDATDDLPVMEELDQVPTLDELSKAIDMLPSGKAPGSDGIPAEVIKGGKPALLQPLYYLF
ncbi:uncharacterized protein LOC134768396 [Penaeus indicus]|uniref:uncharacterized protein LOC134768396 n=1 Tax=Penaeus indicus TaxID=29960 RepID=UPI00300C4A7B